MTNEDLNNMENLHFVINKFKHFLSLVIKP